MNETPVTLADVREWITSDAAREAIADVLTKSDRHRLVVGWRLDSVAGHIQVALLDLLEGARP